MKKLITFTAFIMVMLLVLGGCDSVNVDESGGSSGVADHSEDNELLLQVYEDNDGEEMPLDQVNIIMEHNGDYVTAASLDEDEGLYGYEDLNLEQGENYELEAKRTDYEDKEFQIYMDDYRTSHDVEMTKTEDSSNDNGENGDQNGDDEEIVPDEDDFVKVAEGKVDEHTFDKDEYDFELESIKIDYDMKMSQYVTTNAEFVEFLNDAGVAPNGDYSGEKMLDLDSEHSQIEYADGKFKLRDRDDIEVDDYPVIEVTWYGAAAYANWLSEKNGFEPAYDLSEWELKDPVESVEGYRLPTEEEWEFAARGGVEADEGNPTLYPGDNEDFELDDVAWHWGNSDGEDSLDLVEGKGPMPVGEKDANELDLYDMSGNVREWTNTDNVYMNGSWGSPEPDGEDDEGDGESDGEDIIDHFRVNYRYEESEGPAHSRRHIGFRLIRTEQ